MQDLRHPIRKSNGGTSRDPAQWKSKIKNTICFTYVAALGIACGRPHARRARNHPRAGG